ncbi:MAG: chromosome segregation protein SMC [Nitrospirae bacterium]|nr:chromosome segregation protein SMC [Nitrospirota bacterium]
MRIEKIELNGFKSFADRTSFHFHPGTTCIVGPNGCGKSNIVDAFRWVLGEQSARSLRGEKMEEVIFNGSVSKKPRGMAEVTMVISGLNGLKQSSLDGNGGNFSDTASVTRRLYRSGESEYILNKDQCRLKDIKELFLDTGLEAKSYSILEQDRISELLNAKPQERRILIEEIAGVMKYNVRKREAISKLESSRANLQRINDITTEVKKQISLLDRLAKKAERYKKLIADINAIELKIAKRDYQNLKESFEKILLEYNSLKEEEAIKRANLSEIENQTETKRFDLLQKEKLLESIQLQFQNVEREIAELEKKLAVSRTEQDNAKEYLSKLYQQSEEYNKKQADALIKQEELYKIREEFLCKIENQKGLLVQKSEFLKTLEDELLESEELAEDKRRELFRISEELSSLRNEKNQILASFENLDHREAISIKDIENVKKVLSEVDTSLKDLADNILEKNNELMLLKEKKEVFIKELFESKEKIENLREKLSGLKEELASNTSRMESLKELIFDESAKDLFSQDLSFKILAYISDVIEVDDKYEKAIESALSDKVNSFILSSFDDIEAAIALVKEKSLGRTAFIPVSPVIHNMNSTIPEGSLGRVSDFIRTNDEFSYIANSLFQNFFVVKDMKTAINLIKSGKNNFFVTLDGEVIEPSGAVIAGEVKGIFRRKRELRELESRTGYARDMIEHLQNELNSFQNIIKTKESELEAIETVIVQREKEISLLKLTAENSREDRERRNKKLAYLTLELEQIVKEKEAIGKLLNKKESEIQFIEEKKADIEQQNDFLQEDISQKRAKIDEHKAEVTEVRLLITSFKEKIDSIGKEIDAISKEIEENRRRRQLLAEEVSSIKFRIAQHEQEISENEEKLKSLVSVADTMYTDISRKKEIIENNTQELMTIEQAFKILRNQIESLSQKISGLDIQRTELRLKMENLSENIQQNYGLDIAIVDVEPLTEDDETRLIQLKEKVSELGQVNLGTLEEYEELRTRYEFLKTQQDDLNRSIAELEEAISKINITTRKKLREAYEALKAKFSEVFVRLFGGGRAELILTDENNILETGIDIIAQPPGKKLQNINLLSGGEKTLTALSLLFASFLIKPTPLCILDEADSALDEANTEKFAQTIKELSKDTQFIVVTHNRYTVSIADYIYGITMEEAGVSKVISMQLVEAS